MMILEEIKKIDSSRKKLVEFSRVVGIACLLFGGLLCRKHLAAGAVLVAVGVVLLAVGALRPGVLAPLQKGWMVLAVMLGWVMTHVVMTLFFFLAITPMALGARLFGKKFLDVTWDRSTKSYWKTRESKKVDPSIYERQF